MAIKKSNRKPSDRLNEMEDVSFQFDPAMASFDDVSGRLVLTMPVHKLGADFFQKLADALRDVPGIGLDEREQVIESTITKIRDIQLMTFLRECRVD